MQKSPHTADGKKKNAARIRYGNKRHSPRWKSRKHHRRYFKDSTRLNAQKMMRRAKKKPVNLPAPAKFSLLSNTNEVLKYFDDAHKLLKKGQNVELDISKVDKLTIDSIALMIASINRSEFMSGGRIFGNAPEKTELNKLFIESGFYDHVSEHNMFNKKSDGDLLHKEVSKTVDSDLAYRAWASGVNHVFGNETPFDALYDIIIECMSNTHDHASKHTEGECRWWIYAHNYPNQCRTGYTFIDLGVGIFKSVAVEGFLQKLLQSTGFRSHTDIVPALLAGTIHSRVSEDNDIRGKGIPEIVSYAKSDNFSEFYIISNDVKINVKTGEFEQLEYELKGTLLYWELCT